jgi:glycosyltransferase involved in cell wall biosynthesis
MKVLHIIPSISRKRGGPSTAIMQMVRSLRHEDIDASILTTNDNKLYREDNYPLGQWFCIDEVPILMFPALNSKSRFLREYLIAPKLSCWLIDNIDNYDVLHIHSVFSYASTTSMLLARLKRKPYIVRTIGQLSSWSLRQSRWRKSLMLFLVERGNLINSLAIHVTSKSEMDDLSFVYKHNNVLCLELGVDLSTADPCLIQVDNKKTRFIFLSRIHPKKKLDFLLEAFYHLKNTYQHKNWHLIIAGDGDNKYVEALKDLAKSYGINDYIDWVGHIDGEEKLRLLRNSDWYVLPSMSENFGLSVVEALAQGVPVIISKEVGISDIINQNGAGLICGKDISLVDALNIALKGAPPEMKDAALKLAREKFSWKSIAEKLALFYQKQLKTKSIL